MKRILALLAALGFIFTLAAQQPVRDPSTAERVATPENLGAAATTTEGESGAEAVAAPGSDAGAQRPLRMKKTGASPYFGYVSKYFYRSNPLMADGPLTQQKTAMWTNTFFAGMGLGAHEVGDSVITPYAGASWTVNDFIEGGLDSLNYNSTGAYAMLLAQYANGWSSRIGVNYFSDVETATDTQSYAEFNPNIGLMKAHSFPGFQAVIDLSAGLHRTNSDAFDSTTHANITDDLDNWDVTAKLALHKQIGRVKVTPAYRLSYKSFSNGDNDGRNDINHDLGLDFDVRLGKGVSLTLGAKYSTRDSSGGFEPNTFDFENFDTGGGLSINARF